MVSIIPPGEMPPADWPATVVIPSGMGDARNLLMALAGDACIVIGGRAGTISEVCLAWLHKRPLLPLVGHGGWSDALPSNPPDERKNSPILPWGSSAELAAQLRGLGLATAQPVTAKSLRPPVHCSGSTLRARSPAQSFRTASSFPGSPNMGRMQEASSSNCFPRASARSSGSMSSYRRSF